MQQTSALYQQIYQSGNYRVETSIALGEDVCSLNRATS